jgi:hypothetical protein
MADLVRNGKTSLSTEEVIVRAVQFFSTEKFKATSQSARNATFEGRPPFPWGMILVTAAGLVACVVPGVIMYFMLIRKFYRFYSLVVTANPIDGGAEVCVTYPDFAGHLVPRFLATLAPLQAEKIQLVDHETSSPE